MSDIEFLQSLLSDWDETKQWAELTICDTLNLANASDVLQTEYRGKHQIGETEWFYRTHGIGVDISKLGNKGGIDFDFGEEFPCRFKFRDFMVKQMNDGKIPKKVCREFLQDHKRWQEAYEITKYKQLGYI